jgi:mannose/fructose/N-acetylgalactosamine-specific phosphotransferase system component IIC
MTPVSAVAIVAAGWIAGLDPVSGPQAMYSRPLVAGLLGGAAAGAPLPGLAIGALLELFALDTLPVGASRYPDWGPGSVAVGALAAINRHTLGAPGLLGLVLVAVCAAWLGGWLSHVVRSANSAAVLKNRAALERGDAGVVAAIQRGGLFLDGARALALTALSYVAGALVLALLLPHWALPLNVAQVALVATSIGVALYAGWRFVGRRGALWFAGGLAAGVSVAVWLR